MATAVENLLSFDVRETLPRKESSAGDAAWFLASVNGGVWRSTTLAQANPHWENVLDGQPVTCSSIAALHAARMAAERHDMW